MRKSPESGDEVVYLTSLVKLMIKEDIRLARYGVWAAAATDDRSDKILARQLPVISEEFTSSTSMDGSSQKVKQKRLISEISLFSRQFRPKEAALGFVRTALCVCFISDVFPFLLKNNKSQGTTLD